MLEENMCRVAKDQYVLVLILVLMEYARRDDVERIYEDLQGLNPCSNGICSKRHECPTASVCLPTVLILVLMEYARRDQKSRPSHQPFSVLILVLMEYARRVLYLQENDESDES